MNNADDIKKIYAKMTRICSQKECCGFEIKQKLKRTDLSEKEISEILLLLQKNKFIDNARYARSFINDKLRFNKWGKNRIAFALNQKQIERKIIDDIFSELAPEALTEELKPLLEKKSKQINAKSSYDKRNKLIRFALGRGFEMNNILKMLDKISLE